MCESEGEEGVCAENVVGGMKRKKRIEGRSGKWKCEIGMCLKRDVGDVAGKMNR